jgi:hypothetical protein
MQVRIAVKIVREPGRPNRKRGRLLLALGLVALALGVPLAFAADTFTDVPSSHPFHNQIERAYAAGMIGSCGATTFCPATTITKGQAANQYDKAFGLDGNPRPFTPTWRAVNVETGGSNPPFTVDSTQKVANLNSDLLDGYPASAFLGAGVYSQMSDSPGTGETEWKQSCPNGDKVLAGGYSDADAGTFVTGSWPSFFADGWIVRWQNDTSPDSLRVYVLCANLGAPTAAPSP